MINDDKPPLNEDLLKHHGVKGMHWGVRRKTSSAQIKTARKNVRAQKHNVAVQRTKAVKATIKRSSSAPHERAKLAEMRIEHLKNPDRVTALRLTKGEAAVHALLIATPTAGISLATRAVAGATISSRQRRGVYDKRLTPTNQR